jgi:hypothetical protein
VRADTNFKLAGHARSIFLLFSFFFGLVPIGSVHARGKQSNFQLKQSIQANVACPDSFSAIGSVLQRNGGLVYFFVVVQKRSLQWIGSRIEQNKTISILR